MTGSQRISRRFWCNEVRLDLSKLARLQKDRSGATIVEFALLATPFLLVVFAILETSLVFLGELTLDQAVQRVGRTVRTGEVQTAKLSEEGFRSRLCGEVNFLLDCEKLHIDLNSYAEFSAIPAAAPIKDGDLDASGFGYSPGGASSIVALRVYYKWPIYTDLMRKYLSDMDDGSHLLASMAAFRTEQF